MNAATLRLLLAAGLFSAWIGWLAYLAATATRPMVLSRPQFLVSTLDVLADVTADKGVPSPEVTIREVFWPETGHEKYLGTRITVSNLPLCKERQGWEGPGLYVLPLVKSGDDYRVALTPPSPGFDPTMDIHQPRIYVWHDTTAPAISHQLEEIRKLKSTSPPE
jgi:hypothetical protein